MKKSFLATAVKAATLLTLTALFSTAFADPKISGRLYTSVLYEDADTTETNTVTGAATKTNSDRTTLNSGGSRIRFTGSEPLTNDVDLEYWLEYSIFLDNDGGDNNFTSRNTYLGLKHKDYGSVRIGRLYTPDDDIDYVDSGYLYASGASVPYSYYGQRTNNTIQYISPKINDKTQIKLHYAMDEDSTDVMTGVNNHGGSFTVFNDQGKPTTQKRDLISGHILHNDDKFDAGIAYTYAGDFNSLRAMIWAKATDDLRVGVMAQQVDYNSGDKELGALVTGYYNIDGMTDVYAQAGYADNYKGWKDGERTTASLGLIKWLKRDGARVRAFGTVSYNDETSFKHSDANELVRIDKDAFSVETGLRYDF